MNWFLFYSMVSVIHDIAHPDPPFSLCDTANFTENTVYRSNLDTLLTSISSKPVPPSKFYTISEGTGPDTIYGLFMCYAYASQDHCRSCIQDKIRQLVPKLCLYKSEAVIWDEYCLFRYSTQDFYGRLNVTGNIPLSNKKKVSDPDGFRSAVNETLHGLKDMAAFNSSGDKYWAGSKAFTENDTLNGFVQCSKDLSPNDCNTCLEKAIGEIQDCCYFSRGGRVLSRSCFLRYELYPFDETSGEQKADRKFATWAIVTISSVSGIVLLSALGCCIYFYSRTPKKNENDKQMPDPDNVNFQPYTSDEFKLDPKFPSFEMTILEEATDNFSISNKIGQGGFGPVFKGMLPDGRDIAVKKLSSIDQGSDEFINEVLVIHKLQHINLVSLVGFCIHEEERLLIYEYMSNGSLDRFLWDTNKRSKLKWNVRLNIINGIARGMLYLHEDSRLKVLHRDLKPGNVLLDATMNPKISDFGTARVLRGNDGEANTVRIVGTLGYMAPECTMQGLYSLKSDVFSFGVMLLEIITGKRNHAKSGITLVASAWKLWNEGRGLELMDPLLSDEHNHSCSPEKFLRCMHIGLLCVQREIDDRPSMSYVVSMLNSETMNLLQPKQPASSIGMSPDHQETFINDLSLNGLTISNVRPR